MKKLGIALLAISMCFACGDDQERDALVEGEYENLEDAYERDNATLDALDRCDVAAATVYNNDELLSCEAAFETCSNIEIGALTNKLECEAGLSENCEDEPLALSPECQEGYASIAPPTNCNAQCWLMRLASQSNWCGTPTDLSATPCPGEGAMSWSPGYDLEADKGCRRHDHGTKYAPVGPAVKLGCNVDHDLEKQGGHNTAVYGMFGSWGVSQVYGCFDDGSYNCWKWKSKWWGGYWSYGGHCSGEHTHYGPWRYGQYSHRYPYSVPPKTCSNDVAFSPSL